MTTQNGLGSLGWAHQSGGVLSRADGWAMVGWAVMGELARIGRFLSFRRSPPTALPRLPDSAVAKEAEALCLEVAPPFLVAHCRRTWLWGALLGHGRAFDEELLFVSSMLHDVALTDRCPRTEHRPCFAVAGAGFAQDFLGSRWHAERAALAADAIARHMNAWVPPSRGVEAHLLNAGAACDVIAARRRELPKELVHAVLAAHPADGLVPGFADLMRGEAEAWPNTRAGFLERTVRFSKQIVRAAGTAR